MGVMPCDRNGCENILCRKYSIEYGYVCDECLEEMKDLQQNSFNFSIVKFMKSIKKQPEQLTDLDEIFK